MPFSTPLIQTLAQANSADSHMTTLYESEPAPNMTKNISPIKKKPLHLPGQSLEEHIQYLINDKAGGYIAMAVFSLALAAFEWIQFYNPVPYFHIYWTITAIIVIAFCAFKVMQIRKTVKKLQQGLEGEREVGHFLEQLRAHGYQIFHDIPADNFNIDHVVISEYGLFTIETKTLSRPEKGRFKIIVKGDTVHTPFNQYSQITPQAQGEARWLRETLQNSTGNLYPGSARGSVSRVVCRVWREQQNSLVFEPQRSARIYQPPAKSINP
ncbi:hypothetical protein V5J35_004522 [Endozoicomonas sp. NE40]|uniref:NERD domain-containing protein n=2 Tax=Endozoicomonas lisbonensis TaxID=3120522 RepID=A0ABV2SNJ3_9GAMM